MNKKKIVVLIIMIVGFLLYRYLKIDDSMKISTIIENKDELIAFASKYLIEAIVLYLLVYVILVGLGLPVSGVLSVVAGLLFGLHFGLIIVLLAATCGALVSFLSSRYVFSDLIRKKYSTRVEHMEEKLKKNKFMYLLGMRLIPGIPFSLVNILAGLTSISTRDFILPTVLGMIPGTIVLVYTGNALKIVSDIKELKTAKIIVPVVSVVLIIIIMSILKRVLKNNKYLQIFKSEEHF